MVYFVPSFCSQARIKHKTATFAIRFGPKKELASEFAKGHILMQRYCLHMNIPGTKTVEGSHSEEGVRPVKVIHKKIDQYRNIPIDGVWGMINQNGVIQLELYLEKPPLPTTLEYPVVSTPEGQKLDANFKDYYAEGEKSGSQFIVIREMQAGLILPLAAAMQLHHVLGNFINIARDQMKEIQAQFREEIRQQAELERSTPRK